MRLALFSPGKTLASVSSFYEMQFQIEDRPACPYSCLFPKRGIRLVFSLTSTLAVSHT